MFWIDLESAHYSKNLALRIAIVCKLFADDTTLDDFNNVLDRSIHYFVGAFSIFRRNVIVLLKCSNFNNLEINFFLTLLSCK